MGTGANGLARRAARVLVVDDDAAIQFLVAEVLRAEGYAVAQAAGGPAALARLTTEPADLILLDLLMPEVDGWAFLAAYGQTPGPRAPVILLTAAALDAAGTVAGRPLPPAAATLAKPFDLDHLVAAVAAVVGAAGSRAAGAPAVPSPVGRTTGTLATAPWARLPNGPPASAAPVGPTASPHRVRPAYRDGGVGAAGRSAAAGVLPRSEAAPAR